MPFLRDMLVPWRVNFKHMVTFNFSKVHVKLRCGKEIALPLGLASRVQKNFLGHELPMSGVLPNQFPTGRRITKTNMHHELP